MPNCPPRESLELLLEEALDPEAAESTELHVESCLACQRVLDALVSSSAGSQPAHSAFSSAKSAREAKSPDDDAILQRLERRARRTESDERTAVEGYEIFEELGRGAVGIVYRARHRELNRFVALKMILAGPFLSPKARQRFRVESHAIARLQHPNIVQVHDVGEQSGSLYLALELVEGGSLAALLAQGPRASEEAARIVASMARAVEYAHGQGVIHRDLKPANVLISGTSRSLTGRELKITDFGLAKVAPAPGLAEDGMTLSGEFLGTPAYTAPEQARGDTKDVGPRADVYSLGAILYELLTGRPPFQGASALETLLQVAHHEPVSPARLVPEVPRDLDTICLKCLEKDPSKRFATAADLAADLQRFLGGEPILARTAGPLERCTKWIRRRPARAALLAASATIVIGLIGAGLRVSWQRAAIARAVSDDVRELAASQRASDWTAARTALERARARLGDADLPELRRLVDLGARDLELAAKLESIRLERATFDERSSGTRFNTARADRDYATAFGAAGLGSVGEDAHVVAARVAASNVAPALVAALDDWAVLGTAAKGADKRAWLLDVAQRVDLDPTGWRNRVRGALREADLATLNELIASAAPGDHSVQLLVALGELVTFRGGNAVAFLKRVQDEHPGDFWANSALANALVRTEPDQAVGYYRAALAARPGTGAVYHNLGMTLRILRRFDESMDCFERLLQMEPNSARAHTNMGLALKDVGKLDEAIEQHRRALALDADFVAAHSNLGEALAKRGRLDESLVHAERAVALDPLDPLVHANLALALQINGCLDDAIARYERSIEVDPRLAITYADLAFVLLRRQRFDEAIARCRQALDLDPKEFRAHINLGLALREKGRLDEAIEHFRRAMQLAPSDPLARINLGSALSAQGLHDEAIEVYHRAIELDPSRAATYNALGALFGRTGKQEEALREFRRATELEPTFAAAQANLGLALRRAGDFETAHDALRTALDLLSPEDPMRSGVLAASEECERMIALELRLTVVLRGEDPAVDGSECLRFAELCRMRMRFLAAARFWLDAFTRAPSLADDLSASMRYNAACAAALAGCGRGIDAAGSSHEERARWREQARQWLREDLASWTRWLGHGDRERGAFVESKMMSWKADADLAALRESSAPDPLSADESGAWRELWEDVETLLMRASEIKSR
jgi:serine/threonine-protein kinase